MSRRSEFSPVQMTANETQSAAVVQRSTGGRFQQRWGATRAERTSTLKAKAGKLARLASQLLVLVGVYETGCLVARYLPVDIPGNILGMGLLLALLITGVLREDNIGAACDYLVDHMSIFFIPAGVGIMGCVSLLSGNVLKFAFVCVVTTVIVFLATSYTVIVTSRLMEKRAARKADAAAPSVDNAQEA